MSAIFPPRSQPAARAASAPVASRETVDTARRKVRALLESNDAFGQMAPEKREALARGMVQIATYLAEPDGIRLKPGQQSPQVRALAGDDVDKAVLEAVLARRHGFRDTPQHHFDQAAIGIDAIESACGPCLRHS